MEDCEQQLQLSSSRQEEKVELHSENSRSTPSSSPQFDATSGGAKDFRTSPRMDSCDTAPLVTKNSLPPKPMMLNTNGHGANPLIHGLPFHPIPERNHYRFAEDLAAFGNGSMMGRFGDSLIPKGDPMEAKLQEMLRYNMDKYVNQNLDTLQLSRRVRELLSVHNIGQRLFAKYVLGLSQGTVSELLSKPKSWDKLTEKGRDSYRKMHAWACDDDAVMLLKSLIPKKSK